MINFKIPGSAPGPILKESPSPKKVKREKEFDPEDLPDNIADLSDLADELWGKQDWKNYNLVALLCNKICGWKRQTIIPFATRKTLQYGTNNS
jgi:hypothetical protein